MQIKQGMVVNSSAGHDKNRFYVVMKVDEKYAYIADGKRRKLQKLKPKNFCHMKPTSTILNTELYQSNQKIRRVLHELNCSSDAVAD